MFKFLIKILLLLGVSKSIFSAHEESQTKPIKISEEEYQLILDIRESDISLLQLKKWLEQEQARIEEFREQEEESFQNIFSPF